MAKRSWNNPSDKFNHYYDMCHQKAVEKGQLFLGFIGNGLKLKSKCRLFCKKSRVYWETTSIEKHIKRCGCSCKACAKERRIATSSIPECVSRAKVIEACKRRDSTFLGWEGGSYSGIFSKVVQTCNEHGGEWSTTYMKSLIEDTQEGSGCTVCKNLKTKEQTKGRDQQHIDEFFSTGSFIEGTVFWRSDRKTKDGTRNFWNYTCPKCSSDEYVKAGVCSGVFTAFIGSLKVGCQSCRCSITHKYTKEQKEFRIRKAVRADNIEFKGWEGNGRVKLFCKICGRKWSPSYNNVVFNGNRCPTCSRNECIGGIYPDKISDLDYLYLIVFKSSEEVFVKIGRSFNVRNRCKDFPTRFKLDIKSIISDEHYLIYKGEKRLHNTLSLAGLHYKPLKLFGGSQRECFTLESLNHPDVISTFNLT